MDGSSSLAKRYRVPPLVIGLTIVAFGTSMPELVVNVHAALTGNGDIAFGNIVGSNIANILLILGLTASLASIKVQHSTVWKEIPFSMLAALTLFVFASTLTLDGLALGSLFRFQGIILLMFFAIFLYYVFEITLKSGESAVLEIKKMSPLMITVYILGGLIALYFGGKWTVEGAVSLARLFGLSEYFISLTIVAVGTSLPELVTSIIAAMKKDVDLAVGNVIGSNIFNIFFVMGVSALITPIAFPTHAIADLAVLLGTTILLFLSLFIGKKHELERGQGILFILLYVIYLVYLIIR